MFANFTHYRIIIGEGKISENNDKLFKIVLLSQLNEKKYLSIGKIGPKEKSL